MRPIALMLAILLVMARPSLGLAGGTDINMVVAFDRSESIDDEERKVQVAGLIYALTNPDVLGAIQAGWIGQIGLCVVTWSSFRRTEVLLPWTSIGNKADAERAAAWMLSQDAAAGRAQHGKQTDIGLGISTAIEQLGTAPWFGAKQVINLVSDGTSNIGHVATVDRDRAVALGITINGLIQGRGSAIEVLRRYFRREVIGGPSAFVESATSNDDFADAMLRKMQLEIALLNAQGGS